VAELFTQGKNEECNVEGEVNLSDKLFGDREVGVSKGFGSPRWASKKTISATRQSKRKSTALGKRRKTKKKGPVGEMDLAKGGGKMIGNIVTRREIYSGGQMKTR